MVVSVVLDNEYMGMEARIKWFMKNLSHAIENDYLIITHECLKSHYEELVQNCSERFFVEFEMRHVPKEELERIDICYIPDSFFEDLYKKNGSRSKMLVELSTKRNLELERYLQEAIEGALQKRKNTKVDYIMNCIHCFESINYMGKQYSCPVIPYVFSAIRKVHGYQQTLYMANMFPDLMFNDSAKDLYQDFDPSNLKFDLLDHEEILALLGKKKNLPLMPLLYESGEFEMGVVKSAFQITPQLYHVNCATDDDIYYECKNYYADKEVITRMHPLQLDQVGIGRKHMKNDPASFILSCKRVSTISSQMIMKAVLWNRVPCVLGDALPYSFLFSQNMNSGERISEKDKNFILFCYFIPDSCMFSREYWNWRFENPTANEIMCRHMSEIVKNLGYSEDILFDKKDRLKRILEGRGCDKYLVGEVIKKDEKYSYCYKYLSSHLRIYYYDGEVEDVYCLNEYNKGIVRSKFLVESKGKMKYCIFLPLDDIDGWVKMISVESNQNYFSYKIKNAYTYYPKGESDIKIELDNSDDLEMIIMWTAEENKLNDY